MTKPPTTGKPKRARTVSTQRTLASMLLAFESFVIFFATLVAFGLRVANVPAVWAVGLSLAILMILSPAVLRTKNSYYWGWFLQLATLLTGIWVPLMWIVGGIFVCLWAWAMIAGSTIDKARANYLRLQDSVSVDPANNN
jgi:Sec-independent protein secretion pathway component TatC